MKEIKKTGIFVLIFAAALFLLDRTAGIALDYFFKKTRTGQTGGNINTYLYDRTSAELLMLGDSRCMNQVNPDSFKISSFNLAHAGMDDVFQEALLHLLDDKKRLPNVLLLNIDQTTFADDDAKPGKSLYLKPFYNESEKLKCDIDNADDYEKVKFFFSSYRYNNIVFNIINNSRKQVSSSYNGFEPIPSTEGDSSRTWITASDSVKNENVDLSNDKSERLIRIVELCKQRKIKLILFSAPIFYGKKNLKLKESLSGIRLIAEKRNVPFLDYTRLNLKHFEFESTKLWTDSYHLNANGSAKFSAIISKDVDSLISSPISRQYP